jgi:hypothetical protein
VAAVPIVAAVLIEATEAFVVLVKLAATTTEFLIRFWSQLFFQLVSNFGKTMT